MFLYTSAPHMYCSTTVINNNHYGCISCFLNSIFICLFPSSFCSKGRFKNYSIFVCIIWVVLDFKVAYVFLQVIADKLMEASWEDKTYFGCTHSGLCVPVSNLLRLVSCTFMVLQGLAATMLWVTILPCVTHSNCLLLENIIEMYDFESIHPINWNLI